MAFLSDEEEAEAKGKSLSDALQGTTVVVLKVEETSRRLTASALSSAACVVTSSALTAKFLSRDDRRVVTSKRGCRSDWGTRRFPSFCAGPVRVAVFCDADDEAALARSCPCAVLVRASALQQAQGDQELRRALAGCDHAVLAGGAELLPAALECVSAGVRPLIQRKAGWARELLEAGRAAPYDGPARRLDLRSFEKNPKTLEDSEAARAFLEERFLWPGQDVVTAIKAVLSRGKAKKSRSKT